MLIYNDQGRILRKVLCPSDLKESQVQEGELWIEGEADDSTQYIKDGAVVDMPTMPCSIDKPSPLGDGQDIVTLSGLPEPATVKVSDAVYEVPDGILEFTVDLPGTYKITAEAWPYLTWEGEINAS